MPQEHGDEVEVEKDGLRSPGQLEPLPLVLLQRLAVSVARPQVEMLVEDAGH